jgi:hypothetical protein
MGTSHPRYSQGSTWKTPSRQRSEDTFRSTRKPAVLNYEELGGLSDLRPWKCAHGVHILGYGMRYGPHPTPVVTTCTVVELVGTEGNYSSSTQVGLLSSYLARTSCNPIPPDYIKASRDPLQRLHHLRQYKPP